MVSVAFLLPGTLRFEDLPVRSICLRRCEPIENKLGLALPLVDAEHPLAREQVAAPRSRLALPMV